MEGMSTAKTPFKIVYPSSDGRPMAESDLHRDWMIRIIERLQNHFRGRRVYVSGNLLIYYEKGNPRRCIAPDVFAVKDCDPRARRVFKIWEEKRAPNVVMETTSPTTQREDLEWKMDVYARLKVAEYFLYDPQGEWLSPGLIGYRLAGLEYEPIAPQEDGSLFSAELKLYLWLEDGVLHIRDAETGKLLTSGSERAEQLQEENEELKARVAELEKKLRRKT
jgi:Uma2 family endonuclease